jgi:two-component system, NtrC family, sensor histidine kinase GlrK
MQGKLSTRLGVTHGALVVVLIVLLVVTLQGLLRMLGVMSMVSEQKFLTLDAEEELHRAAWQIEVSLRHGRTLCAEQGEGQAEADARHRIESTRASFTEVFARRGNAAPPPLRDAALRYGALADDALSPAQTTCAFLSSPATEERRTKLDEEMTDVWIDRLHELHEDIEAKEARARAIGTRTTTSGFVLAIVAAVAAVMIARWTARSVTRPIAQLAHAATRLGDGDFAAPIAPVGGPKEVEALRRDLERTREKLLGVDRLKQSFLASVSHELRSPLGRLREAIALLSDGTVGDLSTQQKRVVTLAKRACEQEVRIVEALLDMSRVSSGLPVQRQAGCDIDRVVDAAVESEKQTANERGVSIRVAHKHGGDDDDDDDAAEDESNRNGEVSFVLDSALVERAVANLIRNAVSVSPAKGEVRVVVGEHQTADDGDDRVMRIEVSDDGPGISDEIADRVFEPFLAAAVGDQRPAGIGLGLSFAREVARAHGGELDVVAPATRNGKGKDKGTTFRFEIPIPRGRGRKTTMMMMSEKSLEEESPS